MDYTKYSIERLASTESFVDWVFRSDPEAVKFWDLYIREHPEIFSKVERARDLVSSLRNAQDVHFEQQEFNAIWDRIELHTGRNNSDQQKKPVRSRQLAFVLVSITFLATLSTLFYNWKGNRVESDHLNYNYENIQQDYVEQINETGKVLTITLADGSIVKLENQSRLKYKAEYDNDSTREVYLVGNAFFDVSKNPYRPFIVHSEEVLTKVLGTSFYVQAPKDSEKITVSVKTGKVSVYALDDDKAHVNGNNKNGVILVPNQEVTYERNLQVFEKRLIAAPIVVNPVISYQDFLFENAPIGNVFKTLQDAYGIEIVFNESMMEKCYITAPLGSEPLYEKLKIICQTIGATYEIIDAKVVISSTGC